MSQDDILKQIKTYWTPDRLKNLTNGKNWLVTPESAPDLLTAIGLMRSDGVISRDHVRKLAQVNHMVSLIRPQLEELRTRHSVVRVFDACCGTSYLSLTVAYILQKVWKHPSLVLGLDMNPKVIATSEHRAKELGLDQVIKFVTGKVGESPIADLFGKEFGEESAGRPHLLISLHACDQASDYAIAAGVKAEADILALAPCCHGELSRIWQNLPKGDSPLTPVFQTPNVRREVAAHLTDMLRMLLVRSRGYEVTATEFVPSEHTPKNRLILAERRGKYHTPSLVAYEKLADEINGKGIALERLLKE